MSNLKKMRTAPLGFLCCVSDVKNWSKADGEGLRKREQSFPIREMRENPTTLVRMKFHHLWGLSLVKAVICSFGILKLILLVSDLLIAVTATLLNFIRLFRKAHEENCKQAELERKKAEKEAEMEKAKGINLTKKSAK